MPAVGISRVNRLVKAPRALNDPGMLQQFELERERTGGRAELAAIDRDHGRASDIGPDHLLASRDRLRRYGVIRSSHRGLHGLFGN